MAVANDVSDVESAWRLQLLDVLRAATSGSDGLSCHVPPRREAYEFSSGTTVYV